MSQLDLDVNEELSVCYGHVYFEFSLRQITYDMRGSNGFLGHLNMEHINALLRYFHHNGNATAEIRKTAIEYNITERSE